MLTMLRPRTWVSEREEGDLGPLDFENFIKNYCFLSFEWEKMPMTPMPM